jgi:hypothetical protein
MTPHEAETLVDRLIAAFPRHDWLDDTIDLYARCLERVELDHGKVAVDRAVTTLDLAPTVRWLLDTAHAEARRTGAWVEPGDADTPVNAHPTVIARVRASLAEAGKVIDQRVAAAELIHGSLAGGHWHGGPEPCPICGPRLAQ